MACQGAMVYVRLPQPTHSSAPQTAHTACLACINVLFLFIGEKTEPNNSERRCAAASGGAGLRLWSCGH